MTHGGGAAVGDDDDDDDDDGMCMRPPALRVAPSPTPPPPPAPAPPPPSLAGRWLLPPAAAAEAAGEKVLDPAVLLGLVLVDRAPLVLLGWVASGCFLALPPPLRCRSHSSYLEVTWHVRTGRVSTTTK